MRKARHLATIGCALALLAGASPAQAAPADPLFVFTPFPINTLLPPPVGYLNGPCGLGVDPAGRFYVSDYYHDAVDAYDQNANYNAKVVSGGTGYLGQLAGIDAIDGPCGLAFDGAGRLYVNDYHRAVIGYGSLPLFGAGETITGAYLDGAHPTGIAVDPATGNLYVDQRDHIAVFDSSGAAVIDETDPLNPKPLQIGAGSLKDGYGIAFSQFPATAGRLYVPDAATDTVKVYDPASDKANPIEEIDASAAPNGEFTSLRDAAIALDRVTGEIYVIDNLQPQDTERPQAVVHVFDASGTYKGHLKHLITDALPSGLAVDNSTEASQGRVYVTSGNTVAGTIYAYGPGAATSDPIKLASATLSLASVGDGEGTIVSSLAETGCATSCSEELPTGTTLILSADPEPGSAFAGWSGACEGTDPSCALRVEEATAVRASFAAAAGPPAPMARSAPIATASETQVHGTLLSSVKASLSPKKLPRKGRAPIAVSVEWKVSRTDGTEPPTLKKLAIEINKAGVLDPTGLPTCPYAKIQPASTQRALSNCRSALVGKGSFSALAGLEGQERYLAKGKMLVFNALKAGKPVLFGQIYSAYPFANSFVIVFKVKKAKKGAYGTTLSATLPANLRAWGNLTEISMRLARNYSYEGEKRSFLSAGCPAPKGFSKAVFRLARTSFAFDGGPKLTSTITADCTARG